MEEFLTRFTLFGLPAILVVFLLVELWKRLFPNMKPDKLPWVAMGAGLLVALMLALIDLVPQVEPIIMYILAGLMLGLGAMGGYSGLKAIRGFQSVPPGSVVEKPTGETYTVPK